MQTSSYSHIMIKILEVKSHEISLKSMKGKEQTTWHAKETQWLTADLLAGPVMARGNGMMVQHDKGKLLSAKSVCQQSCLSKMEMK